MQLPAKNKLKQLTFIYNPQKNKKSAPGDGNGLSNYKMDKMIIINHT